MLVTFTLPAPADERYGADTFAPQIGREILLTVPGPPPVTGTGVLAEAHVRHGSGSADLTVDVGDDSDLGRAVIEAAGGYRGHVHVHDDGHVSRVVEIRRRAPEEAASLIREGYRERGVPGGLADAMIAELRES